MPRKRSTVEEQSTTSAPTKRHRVSQACNPCRTAREKCDGTQPNCGPCREQNRTCTYTSPSKKRGIPTGYIRTVELALAWLFDQIPGSEESLHQLLIQDGTTAQKVVLGKEGKEADRLHKRWRKSKVHKEIERLLCNRDGTTPKTESSDADSDTDDEATQDSATLNQSVIQRPPHVVYHDSLSENVFQRSKGMEHGLIKMPANYSRLLDIYFSYTHCWFPILEREDVMRTVLAYPPEGLMLNFEDQLHAPHAQLWAVLALASFQDAASSSPSSDGRDISSTPPYISSIATKFITTVDTHLGISHVRAMLILSLAALGQDKASTAWLLVGSATRLAMQLYPERATLSETFDTPEARLVAGCFILDTLISISLGQYPHWRDNMQPLHHMAHRGAAPESMREIWPSIPGFGSYQDSTETSTQPTTTFLQLYKFSALLANHTAASSGLAMDGAGITSEHLLRSLNPEFAYCNSLIFGGPIPMVPSSFVVQGIFLTASMILMSGRRAASLVPNFLDVAESCMANFGAAGTPPIFLTCMMCLERNGHSGDMHGHDKPRWDIIDRSIKGVWNKHASGTRNDLGARHMFPVGVVGTYNQNTVPPLSTVSGQMGGQIRGAYLPQHGSQLGMHAPDRFPMSLYQQTSLSPSATSPLSCPTPLKTSSMAASGMVDNAHQKGLMGQAGFMEQSLDYDAILEELGSIDCIDGMDMNSQFMTNLGFAPGSDLADMLHGEFGI